MKIGTLVRYRGYNDALGQRREGEELCIILGDVRGFPHLVGNVRAIGFALYNITCNYYGWEYNKTLLDAELYEVLAE